MRVNASALLLAIAAAEKTAQKITDLPEDVIQKRDNLIEQILQEIAHDAYSSSHPSALTLRRVFLLIDTGQGGGCYSPSRLQ